MSIRVIRHRPVPAFWSRCCPFCLDLDHGVTEPELWEHITIVHDAADHVAAVFADIDSDWFDELTRRGAA